MLGVVLFFFQNSSKRYFCSSSEVENQTSYFCFFLGGQGCFVKFEESVIF